MRKSVVCSSGGGVGVATVIGGRCSMVLLRRENETILHG